MSGILAQFDSLGATRNAIDRLREAGHSEMEVFSPFPAPVDIILSTSSSRIPAMVTASSAALEAACRLLSPVKDKW